MWRDLIEQQGFATIPAVLSAIEVEALLQQLSQRPLPRSRAGMRHALRHPAIAQLASDSRLLAIAQGVLGGTAFPFRATVFDKSRNANWLVVWHQDTALPLCERREVAGWGPWSVKEGIAYAHAPTSALTQVLALRVHLDDSTAGNGPLRVLPGTHAHGVLSDDEVYQLSLKTPATDCLIPKGGVLAMRPLLIHASSKSVSEMSRRVVHIEYAITKSIGDGLELVLA